MMAPHNVVVIYKEWVNSILCEEGIQIRSISQLNSENLLLRLYHLLTGGQIEADLNLLDPRVDTNDADSIPALLRLIRADGVRTNLQPSDLISGDFQSLLELLWILILNYGIHIRGQCTAHQRTTSIGTKLLLKWSSELLGGACFDYRLSMTENMEKDVLHNIINNVTRLVGQADEPEPCDYHEAIAEAESKLGVSSSLLRVCDNQTENLAVTVYISLLRRKRELILTGHAPTRPTVLVNQQPQANSSSLSYSNLSMHNDRTQQVLKDIERQLSVYHNGLTSPHRLGGGSAAGPSRQSLTDDSPTGSVISRVPSTTSSGTVHSSNMPSPIARAHGSFPNESSGSLRIDLSHLQQVAKTSCSTTSSPRQNGVADGRDGQTADFAELLRQLKDKERNASGDSLPPPLPAHPAKYQDDDDMDRTSPKSAPNTDEGFGTFTKTTPRGKDSVSDSSDDHTDCEVDHLAAGHLVVDQVTSEEQLSADPGSITEWWDRIEMPSIEMLADVTTLDSTLFKSVIADHSMTRIADDGSIELSEDELMCMIDNIGMNGIKATSGLASAQETELRLLHILKERDDLVLSYHGALKELSKLTARIKDENHLLRQQLNMNDMSHGDIVLALEEQASDGRQLALSLQDDLTDTEVNVLARLREDKNVLEDRLAALEHQYNCDLAKWQSDHALYKSQTESTTAAETGELSRENHMLKLQLEELRNMFDVTMTQTQEECGSYLSTIETLKEEIKNSKTPISESQLELLAVRQAEMERLYESMISSLEGDNSKLQSNLEDLQQEVATLKQAKAVQDKGCGTSSHMTDSGNSTDSAHLVNKGTATVELSTSVKSVETDEDEELVGLQKQVVQLETIVTQGNHDRVALEQQKNGLLENHKHLSDRLNNVESQLQMTQHELATLQAVHELVMSKSESMENKLSETSGRLASESTHSKRLQQRLSAELEKARSESMTLSSEASSTRQQVCLLQTECAGHRQREVNMNTQLTKLTLERSSLQGKVNALNSDLVQQKSHQVSQSLKVQQLEAAKSYLESQTAEFRRDSLELLRQLEEARQEKDDLSQKLSSLHSQLTETVGNWQEKLRQQQTQHQQMKSNMESNMAAQESAAALSNQKTEFLTQELTELRGQLREAREKFDRVEEQLRDVLRTAKLDVNAEDVMVQLQEQLKSLQQQNAEYRFTTTHFRSENSQLQLRVNQLEEINKATEQRGTILQTELSAVQASLDDSYHSADAQLNLLDLSASDLMSISDTSELRNYILAAKKQVEMMQNKRAKSNLEYSRKIFEMEKLMKDKAQSSDRISSSSDTGGGSAFPEPHSEREFQSTSTDYAKLPKRIDMSSSFSSATLPVSLLLNSSQSAGGAASNLVGDTVHQVPSQPATHLSPVDSTYRCPRLTNDHMTLSDNQLYSATKGGHMTSADGMPQVARPLHSHIASQSSQSPSTGKQPLPHMLSDIAPYSTSSKLRYIPPTHLPESGYGTMRPPTDREYSSRLLDATPSLASTIPSDIGDIELAGAPDSLSLKVQSLTNRPGTSTPIRKLSPRLAKNEIYHPTNHSPPGAKMSAIEMENAALRAELHCLNSDRKDLHKHMEHQVGQHDALNDTLDELERSLEEVYDSNKLLKDTLGNCNDFIQTNLLSTHVSPSSNLRSGWQQQSPSSPGSRYITSTTRPHSVTPATRSHNLGPSSRPHSVTPATRSHDLGPSTRPHSVTPAMSASRAAPPFSVSFGGAEVNTYTDDSEKLGWSSVSDKHLTSSCDFNKLQQTNVQNYSTLLHSDTNTKSAVRRHASPSAAKTSDLNHMIQHSLSRLNQMNSSAPSPTGMTNGFTSTPVKSSTLSTSSRYPSSIPDTTDSESIDQYITANQFSRTPSLAAAGASTQDAAGLGYHSKNYHRIQSSRGTGSSAMSYSLPNHTDFSRCMELSSHRLGNTYPRVIPSYRAGSRHLYNDGGPGRDEPKAVLPEPPQTG